MAGSSAATSRCPKSSAPRSPAEVPATPAAKAGPAAWEDLAAWAEPAGWVPAAAGAAPAAFAAAGIRPPSPDRPHGARAGAFRNACPWAGWVDSSSWLCPQSPLAKQGSGGRTVRKGFEAGVVEDISKAARDRSRAAQEGGSWSLACAFWAWGEWEGSWACCSSGCPRDNAHWRGDTYRLYHHHHHHTKQQIYKHSHHLPSSLQYTPAYFQLMKSVIRKLVAGPKKKTPFNGQELDLTYITDRIIAMAYPASNFFEKTYRNSIDDVASYFNEYHKDNYLIINVSSRPYDYALFGGRVRQFQWPDHQAPPLTTLVEIAHQIKTYLQNHPKGVVAVHCNHGKGRTGTAIIAFMLYLSLYHRATDALAFYNASRFSSGDYGVDQPCQTRYLHFLERILQTPDLPTRMIAYRMVTVSQDGLHDKYFLTVKKTRTGQVLLPRFNFGQHSKLPQKPIIGDIFIEIFEDAWTGPKKLARINYHTYFLNPTFLLNIEELAVTFKNTEIKCSKGNDKAFTLKIEFQYFCLCHVAGSEGIDCECAEQRAKEEHYWRRMVEQLQEPKVLKEVERHRYFYCQAVQHKEKPEQKQGDSKKEEAEDIYQLTRNMSNIFVENPNPVGKMTMLKQDQGESIKIERKGEDRTSSSSQDQ